MEYPIFEGQFSQYASTKHIATSGSLEIVLHEKLSGHSVEKAHVGRCVTMLVSS